MAVPVIPLAFVGFASYAVWKAFRDDRSHRAGSHNGWRNEAFSKTEDSKQRDRAKEKRK
ncbi:hypothetical protein [Qipengyuania sp. MTN3-11]|uniref:hypothetical protein n=1 Tax=Qipengyuania sp. MTN3-11 TaxID=3056557 RepID=UPI0036F365D0